MSDSTLDARFFKIRDYDRFGTEHPVLSREGMKNQILFADIPVAADRSYKKRYRSRKMLYEAKRHSGGNIRDAFYEEGHGETAGIFRWRKVIAAFGAKKVVGVETSATEAN